MSFNDDDGTPPGEAEAGTCAELRNLILETLTGVDGVISVSLVGSFVDRDSMEGISDIDTIVIVDKLTQPRFEACHRALKTIETHPLLAGRRLHINDTFGPLKFDAEDCAVIHMMVYDIASHREHVIQSPFTCLDWERSSVCQGMSLKGVYPVLCLQPRDFSEGRRGLRNYMDDLAEQVVSYRHYEFDGEIPTQLTAKQAIDSRHVGEFAYHIIRNTVNNYLKLVDKSNAPCDLSSLCFQWALYLPQCARYLAFFQNIAGLKLARSPVYPEDTLVQTSGFLRCFEEEFADIWERQAIRVVFARHGRTVMNDGTFLGVRRDPSLLELPPEAKDAWDSVFSSPALRSRQTAASLAPSASVTIDERLSEIDYGNAEGMSISELRTRFPHLPEGWAQGEDPAFPGGENTMAVKTRLFEFITDLGTSARTGPILVVSHNVVLRCLVGNLLGVPPAKWHLLPVEHLEGLEVRLLNGQIYPNFTRQQKRRFTDAVFSAASFNQ